MIDEQAKQLRKSQQFLIRTRDLPSCQTPFYSSLGGAGVGMYTSDTEMNVFNKTGFIWRVNRLTNQLSTETGVGDGDNNHKPKKPGKD